MDARTAFMRAFCQKRGANSCLPCVDLGTCALFAYFTHSCLVLTTYFLTEAAKALV